MKILVCADENKMNNCANRKEHYQLYGEQSV